MEIFYSVLNEDTRTKVTDILLTLNKFFLMALISL